MPHRALYYLLIFAWPVSMFQSRLILIRTWYKNPCLCDPLVSDLKKTGILIFYCSPRKVLSPHHSDKCLCLNTTMYLIRWLPNSAPWSWWSTSDSSAYTVGLTGQDLGCPTGVFIPSSLCFPTHFTKETDCHNYQIELVSQNGRIYMHQFALALLTFPNFFYLTGILIGISQTLIILINRN